MDQEDGGYEAITRPKYRKEMEFIEDTMHQLFLLLGPLDS